MARRARRSARGAATRSSRPTASGWPSTPATAARSSAASSTSCRGRCRAPLGGGRAARARGHRQRCGPAPTAAPTLGEAHLLLVRHRGEHRIPDGFCSVDHLLEWAKAGGSWRRRSMHRPYEASEVALLPFESLKPGALTMDKFVIEGGYPLSGTVVPAGNKNAALPILAASLLTEEELVIGNVPRIRDVESMLALLEDLGVSVHVARRPRGRRCAPTRISEHRGRRRAGQPDPRLVPARGPAARARRRGAHAAAGRRLHRPPPARSAPRRARARSAPRSRSTAAYEMWAPEGLRACDFFMDEASVMATENALMAAALTPGTTTIRNAASEPHVQDLARLLVAMGARIDGIGSNVLTVHGQHAAGRRARTTIAPDHIEVGSFMALAAVTGGELRIKDTVPDDLKMIRMVFERLGLKSHHDGDDLIVPAGAAAARAATTPATRSRRSTTGPGRPSRPT